MADLNPIPGTGLLALLDLAEVGACLVDPNGMRVVYSNRAMLRAVGAEALDPGQQLLAWLPELAVPKCFEQLEAVAAGLLSGVSISAQLGGQDSSATIRRVDTESGPRLAVLVKFSSVIGDEPCRSSAAGFDSLTGLADRGRLMDRLTRLVPGIQSSSQRFAVLFLDLDGFKEVNDSHGHLVGDQVLQEVARRLTSCVRAADVVARFGGDEFVILLGRVASNVEIAPVLRRLEAAFEPPIAIPQGTVRLDVSVGVALGGFDGSTAEELISAADRAMYAAKRKSG
jgi:diguanylate cyclase (GGDEF)-like protein